MSKQKPTTITTPAPATENTAEVSFQEQAERKSVRKATPLTADEAIQKVLARPDRPAHHHAGHTEAEAVELLVKTGMDREKAERDVRARLY